MEGVRKKDEGGGVMRELLSPTEGMKREK